MTQLERREIKEAIYAADDALEHLKRARKCLDSAGTWGIFDMFGGNLLTGLLKHSKMASAEREIDAARYRFHRLKLAVRVRPASFPNRSNIFL